MQDLTEEGRAIVSDIAARHSIGVDAVYTVLVAVAAGGGRQAQFNHPDLGGMGQWSQGGMIMVGDMFNNGLKARVDQLCNELAGVLGTASPFVPAPDVRSPSHSQSQSQSSGGGSTHTQPGSSLFVAGSAGNRGAGRWPAELGSPSSAGSQNDLHYAVFPDKQRLAVSIGGKVTVYNTGDHRISGFSQQQGGSQSITFTSQHGLVSLADLSIVSDNAQAAPASSPPPIPQTDSPTASTAASQQSDEEIFVRLERLAELHKKDVLTAEEFLAKKAELLARL